MPKIDFRTMSIGAKLIVLTVPLIALATMVAAGLIYQHDVAKNNDKLEHRARSLQHQIMADRAYYASVVVPKIKELEGTVGVDYKEVHGRFPLPATFVREVAEATKQLANGYTVNLISPWPINKDKGITDDFHRDAFAYLSANPKGQFIRNEVLRDRKVMRYMAADIAAAQSCVNCHNAHAQSPRHDFKLNDLMGGLEIIIPMDQYVAETRRDLLVTVSGGVGLCLLVLGIMAMGTNRTVHKPLQALAGRMAAFVAKEDAKFMRPWAPAQAAKTSIGDEATHITATFERMQGVIVTQQNELREANQNLEQRVIERTDELRRTMEEKERIGSELRIASDIQRSILPRTFPPFPHRQEFELYAETIPAREMGGDFYDFFLIDGERLGFVIADVSGKGVPAAIFMAVSRTLVKATALTGVGPDECLQQVNRLLCPDNDAAMFVTVFYGILNAHTGVLEYSNGGHNIPYHLGRDGRIAMLEKSAGMALGIADEARFETKRLTLQHGDALFLYTDGVTEAMDSGDRMFTEQRLEEFLQRSHSATPAEQIHGVVGEVRQFSAGTAQSDDITVLALRFGKASGAVREDRLSVTLTNQLTEIERLSAIVDEFGGRHGIPPKVLFEVNMSLDEVLTNIISYGYADALSHDIIVRLSCREGTVSVEVEDDGRAFNPLTAPEPDLTKPLEERPIGGLGVHLIKTMMDALEYRRERDRNILTFKKRFAT